jgi:hypothetical protein
MNLYHAYFDLKPGIGDLAFCGRLDAWLGHLRSRGLLESWRLTRAKLGLGLRGVGEFHLMMEVKDLAQLEAAFQCVSQRREPEESLHFDVNSAVQDIRFALTRDFPDPQRQQGEERF